MLTSERVVVVPPFYSPSATWVLGVIWYVQLLHFSMPRTTVAAAAQCPTLDDVPDVAEWFDSRRNPVDVHNEIYENIVGSIVMHIILLSRFHEEATADENASKLFDGSHCCLPYRCGLPD